MPARSILLPSAFILPSAFSSDPDINATIISMGAAAYDAGYTHLSDIIKGAANAEVATIIATSEKELREKTQEYERRCEKLRSELEKRQNALDDAWDARRIAVENAAADANQEILRLRTESALDKRIFLKTLEDLRKEFNAAERIRAERVSNSSKKGAAGEMALAEIIEAAASDFDATVSQMTTSPESGDFHVIFNDIIPPFKILIDAKSYTRNVDHEERAKIRHDIECCPDVSAGILVSLYSGIVGSTDGEIEFINNRPLLNICKLMNGTPDSRVKTLSMAFSILRNHAKWDASQHAIAAAHAKFQYYRRILEQLQNQIGAAEKHALATLRDIVNMQSSVSLLQIEFLSEESINDDVSSWWSTNYEKSDDASLDAISIYSKWIADGKKNITKASFMAILGLVCGSDSFNMIVQTGPAGNKRLVDQTLLHGWKQKRIATTTSSDAIAVHIYDSHTETIDKKKTFTYIRKFLSSKNISSSAYKWSVFDEETTLHHHIILFGVSSDILNLNLLKSWVGNDATVIADDCNITEWKPTGIVKDLAGPGAKWKRDALPPNTSNIIHIV